MKRKLLIKSLTTAIFLTLGFNAFSQCPTVTSNSTSTIALASVSNPTLAYDGDMTTYATLNSVGAGEGILNLNFSQPTNPGDSIIFYIMMPTVNLANYGSLQNTVMNAFSAANGGGSNVGTKSNPGIGFVINTAGTNSILRVPVVTTGAALSAQVTFFVFGFSSANTFVTEAGIVSPGPPTSVTGSTICNGVNTGSLTASYGVATGNNITFKWYTNAAATGSPVYTSTSSGPTTATSTYANAAVGTTYYVTENETGCSNISPATSGALTQYPALAALNASSFTTSCNNPVIGSTTYSITVAETGGSGSYSYAWTATPPASIVSGSTSATASVSGSGTYNVVVTDNAGCGSKTASVSTSTSTPTGTTCTNTITTVLPVTGLALTAQLVNSIPQLNWTTLTEQNTSYFRVQSSSDGSNFTTIGKVAAAGNSNEVRNYSFTDNSANGSVIYYRLQTVDYDGNIGTSNIVAVRLSISSPGFKIYPNPATNLINIETGVAGNYQIEIFSNDGQRVQSSQIASASGILSLTLNRTGILSGMYVIKATNLKLGTSQYSLISIK